MTKEELKKLEDNLWDSANSLRATGGIKSADYAVPVLGIIFLRFADNKYAMVEDIINAEYEAHKGTRMEVPIQKIAIRNCGLYLSEKSRYEYLLELPKDKSIAEAIKSAMLDIELHQDEQFKDILPTDAYAQIEKNNKDILPELIKTFSDIPKDASGDIFGKIYEYFLGKFALSEAQKGGEFFTPTSVVKFIVEAIEPYKGKIFDPACGSGGMFVQSANFIERSKKDKEAITVYGQEHEQSTVKLAKMNLLINNLRGEIKKANSYEDDFFKSENKFDFVMANPPFNVKGVKESSLKGDTRFTHYGLPKSKGKKDDKITDANYLWISLFATSLNDNGRAGFVMPNSASDARNSEYEIRKKLVDSNIVDCMVSIPSKMFYTVTLPATLWFFDKAKTQDPEDILFIDARNVFTQIDRTHREWSAEQVQNLASIVRLHRGEQKEYLEVLAGYIANYEKIDKQIDEGFSVCEKSYNELRVKLSAYVEGTQKKSKEALNKALIVEKIENLLALEMSVLKKTRLKPLVPESLDNKKQLEFFGNMSKDLKFLIENRELLEEHSKVLLDVLKVADKSLKIKVDEKSELSTLRLSLEVSLSSLQEDMASLNYWHKNIEWLQTRFPDAKYTDVLGLCKVAKRDEYVEEQDYSLNAGRYVGIELEEDNLTKEEFAELIKEKHEALKVLNEEAHRLEALIDNNIQEVL
ncbi:MAG: Type I restriction-modification system, DNA-methyltransferase subunit M (EC [uncultured Sulfurovum sp.]|uniref:site-specific DNA-methyltransferase (adenine-specific) n=1 Tax=uncultured Sulfurovum sp. TaxID=269237 RepID=A0A6S6S9H6_9BACT|nr:MAG: Type I restriction-modification system, DNA-methyltransferase subunit M (EC [uncultured Sulfurovum sp.]